MLAHWRGDVEGVEKEVQAVSEHFSNVKKLPVAANLVLNCLSFNLAFMGSIYGLGFSETFQRYALLYMVLPQIVGSVVFYAYKYTIAEVLKALDPFVILHWVHNFILMAAVALFSWELNILYLAITPYLENVLPEWLRGELSFPISVKETYFSRAHLVMMCFGVLLFLTLPYWKAGYELNMKLADRRPTMGYVEMAMELMYFTATWPQHFQFMIPLGVFVQNVLGFKFLIVHIILAMIEFSLINFFLLLKFEPMHMFMHKVKPLYRMSHYEHHVCKSIHPTTGGAGTWELFTQGGTSFFSAIHFHSIPYVPFFMLYGGVSLIGHQMANSKLLVQWHTLHHIVVADIYAGNVPSAWDEKHSRDVNKYKDKLMKTSPFVKYAWLPDAIGGVCFLTVMAVFHYALGWSIMNVWDQRNTV